MDSDFTKKELQHMMAAFNSGYGADNCETCSSIRKKIEEKIKSMPEDEFYSLD
jgi:hypothetical protein